MAAEPEAGRPEPESGTGEGACEAHGVGRVVVRPQTPEAESDNGSRGVGTNLGP